MKKTYVRRINFGIVILITILISGVFVNANNNITQYESEKELVIFNQTDNKIQVTIQIDDYEIKNNDDGTEIYIENFGNSLAAGKPNLPSRIFAIAIPPGAKISDVYFKPGDAVIIPGNHQIKPVQPAKILSEDIYGINEEQEKVYNDNYNLIYNSNNQFPSSVGEFVRTAGYRKYNLVDVRIMPFSYKPISGELFYYPEITVEVTYTIPESGVKIMKDNLASTEKIAEEIIINYDQTANWYKHGTSSGKGLYDYVIITLDSLTSHVTPLVTWEASKGRNVNVVTTSWINTNYAGYDLAEKIRNFLREKLPSEEWGIEDVCIIGGYDDVPMRRCWQDLGYGKPETDYYYAELSLPDSQSWDADGDSRYGEDSDPIDFYTEINVGRIPWSDPDIVEHICQKSVLYEQTNDPSFKKNILLLGGFFWDDDPNPRTDNAVLMEEKVDQPWMSDWTMTRLYETGYTTFPHDYDLTRANVMSVWTSNNFAFVNWAGHGSPSACYRYHPSESFIEKNDCDQLNDDYPAIIFADACSNSDTDYLNIGQAMLQQGAVGFVGATKVALGRPGWENPNDGSSQSLDYYFTISVTSTDYTQGAGLQRALREMYQQGLWSVLRYETFEWGSLWGNPDLSMAQLGDFPIIEIGDISAGFGTIETSVSNTGTADAVDVSWSISVNGGIFGFVESITEDSIDSLKIGESVNIKSEGLIFGLGPINIVIKASSNIRNLQGLALGPILIITD